MNTSTPISGTGTAAATSSAAPSGILLIDKPQGLTSHDVVGRLRRLYGTKQVGHTGTLDPLATGLLTVLIGRAVKASEYAMAQSKRYVATLHLGMETDSEDVTGTILGTCDSLPASQALLDALASFRGEILQTPPMVSAIKVGGKKLMDLARAGQTVEREARPITIHSLEGSVIDEASGRYTLDVHCSKGTYIRTLCADIGKKLGCGGVMETLRRTENGPHSIAQAHTLEQIEAMTEEDRISLLLPTESLFADRPALHLSPFFARLSHTGNPIYLHKLPASALRSPASAVMAREELTQGDLIRLYDSEGFFALGKIASTPDGMVAKSEKLFRL